MTNSNPEVELQTPTINMFTSLCADFLEGN
jgi:hypothetical protein